MVVGLAVIEALVGAVEGLAVVEALVGAIEGLAVAGRAVLGAAVA